MILAGKICASVDEPLRGWFNFTATRYSNVTAKAKTASEKLSIREDVLATPGETFLARLPLYQPLAQHFFPTLLSWPKLLL
jgi:hypothetical protein